MERIVSLNGIQETVGVPDKPLSKHAVGHAWGNGHHIALFPTSFPSSDARSLKNGVSSRVFSVTWETTVYDPQVRKLVNESCNTFVAIQKLTSEDGKVNLAELAKLSYQYRSVINACVEHLNQASDCATGAQAKELQNLSDVFYKVELVWNLCEIMYLEKPIGILPHLLEWVRIHFPSPRDMCESVLESSNPSNHDDYWNSIYGLVLQLHINPAIKLLRHHADFSSDAFQSTLELLKKMPIYGLVTTISAPEFTFRWNHWREECEARLENGDFYDIPELELLVKILCGKEQVFDELESHFETWYQRLVSVLAFTQPTISAGALAAEAERCMSTFCAYEETTCLDSTLLAILRKDTQKVIGEMQNILDNCWFSAHLADLLYHAGVLHSFEDVNSAQLRETLLRDYALCLFSHQSLWTIGVLYLDHCPATGLATLETLLTRLPCQSEYKVAKILAIAERRKLTSVSASVCRVSGRRALNHGRLGAAVAWAVRAQDGFLATHAADAVLKNYLQDSDFSSTDLLDSLGAGLLASDRLAFLGKYREFHRLYSKSEFRPAASLLTNLISSRIAPKYFWTVLLMDALPLLETNPPVFTSDETYELMQSLQELTSSFQEGLEEDDEPQVHPSCKLNPDKTMLITLALSRNLAKCFVQEAIMN